MSTLSKEQLRYKMSRIQGKNTKPELLIRFHLHKLGYRFRLHDKNFPGKPDIVLKKFHTVIFVNGCFWHQHPKCKLAKIPKTHIAFWKKKLRDNVKRQQNNINLITSAGYKIIILWECHIYKNVKKTIDGVVKELKKQSS